MLISLTHKFIFVANLKTASTSIEAALRPYADIAILRSEWGKHASIREIESRYSWVFDVTPRDQFIVFGVLRDPIGYAASLYTSHKDPKFAADPTRTTLNMTFSEFLVRWPPLQPDQYSAQSKRFVDAAGECALDYLIDYAQISNQWPQVISAIGLPNIKLNQLNVSPETTCEISETERKDINSYFSEDVKMLHESTGRWLRPGTRSGVIVKSKRVSANMETRCVSRDDLAQIVGSFLGPPSPTESFINEKMATKPSLGSLLEDIKLAPEFIATAQRAIQAYLHNQEKIGLVEIKCSTDEMNALLDHTEHVWASYGIDDPYYSVLTNEKYKRDNINEAAIEEFYLSGRDNSRLFFRSCDLAGMPPRRAGTVLDFGCGLGRVGKHLAQEFDNYIGVDISQPHMNSAQRHFETSGITNATFIKAGDFLRSNLKVDAVYSVIVLQHNAPPVMAHILRKLCQSLSHGGVIFVQIPICLFGYSFKTSQYLSDKPTHGRMEMHCMPQGDVLNVFREEGLSLGRVTPDAWIGRIGVSYTFVAQKN